MRKFKKVAAVAVPGIKMLMKTKRKMPLTLVTFFTMHILMHRKADKW